MEKSLKSITQYSTDEPISLQNVIALQVYNHGDLPLKINGIVIMPKETFPLVTPDGCLAENYQVTPEFFDLNTIAFYFPSLDAKSITTTPKFTLLSSVYTTTNNFFIISRNNNSKKINFWVSKDGNYRIYFNGNFNTRFLSTLYSDAILMFNRFYSTDIFITKDNQCTVDLEGIIFGSEKITTFIVKNLDTGEFSQQFCNPQDF